MSILIFSLIASLAAIIFAAYLAMKVLAAPQGSGKMVEIAQAIKEGAQAYLNRQTKTVGIVAVILALVLYFTLGFYTMLGFLVGAFASALAGYIGMNVAGRMFGPRKRRNKALLRLCGWLFKEEA